MPGIQRCRGHSSWFSLPQPLWQSPPSQARSTRSVSAPPPSSAFAPTTTSLDRNTHGKLCLWCCHVIHYADRASCDRTSSIIYFGAICGVFPSLFIMQKVKAAKWLAGNTMCWGIILCAMAGVKNFAGLMVSRFILGIFESVIFGGFGLIVAMWWKKEVSRHPSSRHCRPEDTDPPSSFPSSSFRNNHGA
jgi:hypothetical protein